MHDANVYKHSPIYAKLNDINNPLLAPHHHILGDNAYPNSQCMITQCPNNGRLTNAQTKYKTKLSSVRQVIEREFGLRKGKFRRLKNFCNLEIANSTISACCMLHNFIIMKDGLQSQELIEEQPEQQITEDFEFEKFNETNKRLLYTSNFEEIVYFKKLSLIYFIIYFIIEFIIYLFYYLYYISFLYLYYIFFFFLNSFYRFLKNL